MKTDPAIFLLFRPSIYLSGHGPKKHRVLKQKSGRHAHTSRRRLFTQTCSRKNYANTWSPLQKWFPDCPQSRIGRTWKRRSHVCGNSQGAHPEAPEPQADGHRVSVSSTISSNNGVNHLVDSDVGHHPSNSLGSIARAWCILVNVRSKRVLQIVWTSKSTV